MLPRIVSVSAVCMVLAFSGWSRDDPLDMPHPPESDMPNTDSVEQSSWQAYVGTWLDPSNGHSCGCGLTRFKQLIEGTGDSHKLEIYPSVPRDEGWETRPTSDDGNKSLTEDHGMKLTTGNDNKYEMAAVFLRNSDLIVLITSVFQVCWILKMVVWRGLNAKTTGVISQTRNLNNDSENTDIFIHDSQIDDMRKAIERLTEYQEHQESALLRKDDELEHLAKTVEYVHRKSTEEQSILKQKIAIVQAIARRILRQPKLQRIFSQADKDFKTQVSQLLTDSFYGKTKDNGGGDVDVIPTDVDLEWDF